MRLGEYTRLYREEHDNMSMREFARRAGMSVSHLSNIERGRNNEGKPLSPTLDSVDKVAGAVGLTLNELLAELSDFVRIGTDFNDTEIALITLYRKAPRAIQDAIMVMLAPYDKADEE